MRSTDWIRRPAHSRERIAVERSETLDVLHVENDAGETGIHDR
jgi:hypothetical protein